MKYISIIILVFIATFAVAADYGDEQDFSASKKFTYFKVETEESIFYAESYILEGDTLTLYNLFIEGSSKEYSEFMIIPKSTIISIQKKTAESKDKAIGKHGNGCFINTVRL